MRRLPVASEAFHVLFDSKRDDRGGGVLKDVRGPISEDVFWAAIEAGNRQALLEAMDEAIHTKEPIADWERFARGWRASSAPTQPAA